MFWKDNTLARNYASVHSSSAHPVAFVRHADLVANVSYIRSRAFCSQYIDLPQRGLLHALQKVTCLSYQSVKEIVACMLPTSYDTTSLNGFCIYSWTLHTTHISLIPHRFNKWQVEQLMSKRCHKKVGFPSL